MTERLDLPDRYRRKVEALLSEHVPEAEVWAYGSRVTGRSHDASDLDLVLRGPNLERIPADQLADLEDAFKQSNIPILIQTHDWSRLPASFHEEIEQNYVVIQMSTWVNLPFSEVVEINPKVVLQKGQVYPFISMAAVNPSSRWINPTDKRQWQGSGSRFRHGDTLMARITPCLENGKIAQYRSSHHDHVAHGSTEFIILRNKPGRTIADFIYYFTQLRDFQTYAVSHMSGTSGRQRLPLDCLDHVTMSVPPLDDQHQIVRVLNTLDDRIELTQRMSKTLEDAAQTLFKSWFINFDPVRAKADGHETSLPAHLSDLFPNSLVDSTTGLIPSEWRICSLDDLATFVNGLALQKFPPAEEGSLPIIKIAQLRSGSLQGADLASVNLDPRYIVDNGDILFSWSGSLECRIWTSGRGALNQHLFKVVPNGQPMWLCYFAILRHLSEFREVAAGKATTMGHIQRHHLREAKIAIPFEHVLERMDAIMSPILARSIAAALEANRLRQLRDVLLPMLVSGQRQVYV